jgi:hypothetical protein
VRSRLAGSEHLHGKVGPGGSRRAADAQRRAVDARQPAHAQTPHETRHAVDPHRSAVDRPDPANGLGLLWLQGTAGNEAVAGALAVRPVQRQPDRAGWTGADKRGEGWNAGDKVQWGIHRVPLEGLTLGNQEAFSGDHTSKTGKVEHGGANEREKTTESAAGRAIVLVPEALEPSKPVSVLLHLHGYTSRSWDPYAGWRQRSDDHTVRDVALDRIEQQMNAVSDPQLVGVLPQGVGHSEFGGLTPEAYLDEVMRRLGQVAAKDRIPVPDLGKGFKLVLSAHSGGGHTVKRALEQEGQPGKKGEPPGIAPAEVVLFEAINNPGELKAVNAWVDHHLDRTVAELERAQQAGDLLGQANAIAACPTLRAYRSASAAYRDAYNDLDAHIRQRFKELASELGPFAAPLRDHFRVAVLAGTKQHEQTVRGLGDDPAGGPLADALGALADPSRASKLVRDTPKQTPKKTPPKTAPKTPPKKAPHSSAEPARDPGEEHAASAPAKRVAAPLPVADAAGGRQPAGDFVHNSMRTTLELLPEAERTRFEAIAWNGLDYPGAKMAVKDVSDENLEKWRTTPGYVLDKVEDKKGNVRWFVRGAHQREAQRLLDALAGVRPGGGERRANTGAAAILTAGQYRTDPARYDEYIVGQLGPVQSYDRKDPDQTKEHQLNKHAAEKFATMLEAATADGVRISINNSFRPRKVAEANAAKNANPKAVAKYSSHSLGLAMDLNLWTAAMGKRLSEVSTAMTNVTRMLGAPTYKWMFERGAEFGFYQYRNEPWHWEYNPPGFGETFWAEAPDLAPQVEEAPARKPKRHS